MLFFVLKKFFSKDIFDVEVKIVRKLKKHITKLHFRVVSKYKRFFQLKNRFLAVNLRTLFLRNLRKWRFRDFFYLKKLNTYKFKFFSYKLALIFKQLLKYLYICNENTFKRNITNKLINFSNRLDLVCVRVRFFKTLLEARKGIILGLVHVNNITITYWNFYLKKYDFVTLHIPQDPGLLKAKKFIYRKKKLFRYGWRIPLALRFIHSIFNFINQFRLYICEFSLLLKSHIIFLYFGLHIFLCMLGCFLNFFKYWLCIFRNLLKVLPRTYLLCLYYLRAFFKRKIFNFVNSDQARYLNFFRKKFYRLLKRFKGRRGYLGFVYYYFESTIDKIQMLSFKFKRVDKGLRLTRYVSYLSRFMIFFFLSGQFFSIRYKKIALDFLDKDFSFFFIRLSFYTYLFRTAPYFIFLLVFRIIKLGSCFIYFNYRTIVDSVLLMDEFAEYRERHRLYTERKILKCKYLKKPLKIIRRIKLILKQSCAKSSKFLFLFGLFARFHFLFCYLFCIDSRFMYFNLYLYIRFYFKLQMHVRRHFLVFKRIKLKRRIECVHHPVKKRRRKLRRFIKRRFRTYARINYFEFRLEGGLPIVFFNLFMHFNCIDFDFVDLCFFNIKFRKYVKLFLIKSNLKYNLSVSLQSFLNSDYFSLFFLFFNMDNLFRFIYLFFVIRDTIFILKKFKYRKIFKTLKFRKYLIGYKYWGVHLIFSDILVLFSNFNIYLKRLEKRVVFSRIRFRRLFFLILCTFDYLIRSFGFFVRVFFIFLNGLKRVIGFGYLNLVYNKFLICNWYSRKSCFLTYSFKFLKLNYMFISVQNMYFFDCFLIFKKFTSFFKKNFKFFNLFLYKFCSVFNVCFYLGYALRCFIFNNKLIFVSDYFYYFLVSYCLRVFRNLFENWLYSCVKYDLFDILFNDAFNINIYLFKFYLNLHLFLFKFFKGRFWRYVDMRYYLKVPPMYLRFTFVRQTFTTYFRVFWTRLYSASTSALYRAHKYNYLYMRQYVYNYILRYHFNLNINITDVIKHRYIRKMKTNFFFSKSFLYYDVECNITNPSFIYIGIQNSYIRRMQMRFNFFMTLILRFYVHAKSLSCK